MGSADLLIALRGKLHNDQLASVIIDKVAVTLA